MRRKRKVLLALLILLLGLAAAAVYTVRIEKVSVRGNRIYSEEEARKLLLPRAEGLRTAALFLESRQSKKKRLAFLDSYELRFTSPFSVELVLHEKNVLGYVRYMSADFYFDRELRVVESVQEAIPGYPLVTGLQNGTVGIGECLLSNDQNGRTIVGNLLFNLLENGVHVDEVSFDSAYRATLRCGKITVLFGGSLETEERCKDLSTALPRLGDTAGILDFQERRADGIYSFRPARP
ncbi:hypothetical protein [Stomatobaculum longum]|uniref:hypothetical protein n=1 Tax=Stomatobaculum longum TaxID=796942 RepID=UPI0028D1CE61|nr:hypothetical protein [Stomatobaculum longum]